jgi:hypothetical protein
LSRALGEFIRVEDFLTFVHQSISILEHARWGINQLD